MASIALGAIAYRVTARRLSVGWAKFVLASTALGSALTVRNFVHDTMEWGRRDDL